MEKVLLNLITPDPHIVNMSVLKLDTRLVDFPSGEEEVLEEFFNLKVRELGSSTWYTGVLYLEFDNHHIDYDKIKRVADFLVRNDCHLNPHTNEILNY